MDANAREFRVDIAGHAVLTLGSLFDTEVHTSRASEIRYSPGSTMPIGLSRIYFCILRQTPSANFGISARSLAEEAMKLFRQVSDGLYSSGRL